MQEFQNTRNPILPLEHHIPDSEARVMPDGKLYVYGSYDDREDVYCSEKYHVVSTPDMEHWTIHDVSLTGRQVPWFINPDGSIDEVKMTSQGVGKPFAPGEEIYGYQACGLKGSACIDTDRVYGEKLTRISAGDEAVFRYVKSSRAWSSIRLACGGV